MAFFGDGAMQQGIVFESFNMAALWKLPVMFVAINNQYGMGTKIDRAAARTDFEVKAASFGLNARRVDGTDVEATHAAASELIEGARKGQAAFLMVDCYRFFGHARKDKSPYRAEEEEIAERAAKDAVAFQRKRLIERGEATAADTSMASMPPWPPK